MLNYIKETKAEMKHVSWPTRRQVIMFTLLVIAISIIASLFLGFFDGVFANFLGKIIYSR